MSVHGRQRDARYDPEPPAALCAMNRWLRENLGVVLLIDYGFRNEEDRSYGELTTAAMAGEARVPVEARIASASDEPHVCSFCAPAHVVYLDDDDLRALEHLRSSAVECDAEQVRDTIAAWPRVEAIIARARDEAAQKR